MKLTGLLSGILVIANIFTIHSQVYYTQHIRGHVIDKDSHIPLIGATVMLLESDNNNGTITNSDGYFDFPEVPVGRCAISISYIGYKSQVFNNLIVKSGKELFLEIELEAKVEEIDEVTIKAYQSKEHPVNDMAMVSARSFSVEETERYAGSWGDPSRMAANFAGVFVAGDQRNDIVIRGNSPTGLIWRLEGIPIPSPNHFDVLGVTGGPVSMINNNLLMRSDFFTGAFPAEYGNGISGVFDLKMRSGNNRKREYVAQLGFNGFEIGVEGPFAKDSKASYLLNYRYSMLGLVDDLLWVEGLPYYQDLSFKLNFPMKKGNLSVFGLGGYSHITFAEIDSSRTVDGKYPESHDTPGSRTGVVGIHYTRFLSEQTRLKTSVAVSTRRPFERSDSVLNGKSYMNVGKYNFYENYYLISASLIKKFNVRNKVGLGIILENSMLDYYIKDYDFENDTFVIQDPLKYKEDNLILFRSYAEWKHRFNDDITLNTGLHYQQFLYNNSFSLEPRVGLKWQFRTGRSISLGYGLHSQKQANYVYFIQTGLGKDQNGKDIYIETNNALKFTKSHQFVFGYDHSLGPNMRFKSEIYYQYLYNVPVEQRPSYFSLINHGADFGMILVDSLVNRGTGKNYGVEFTLEKFYNNNYYFLLTTSLFNSKYKGSDHIERNTVYNGNYVINLLGGYEVPLFAHSALDFNLRLVTAGGRRYIPIDLKASRINKEEVYDCNHAYNPRVANYFRLDGRVSFLHHGKRVTHELALDIANITNHLNEYTRYYNSQTNMIETEYQQGIFPMGLYRINF